MGKKVVFICTGNTCRSPMAAGWFAQSARSHGFDVEAASAGIAAFPGVPYSSEAVEAMEEKGIRLSGGTSQPLSKALVMESDLLLTMSATHRDAIRRKLPGFEGKVFMLSEYAGEGEVEVADPVGQDLQTYREVRDQIGKYADLVLVRMMGESSAAPGGTA